MRRMQTLFVVAFLTPLVLCVTQEEFELLKEENSQLKHDLRRLQVLVGNLQIKQNDTSELEIRVAQLEEEMDEIQSEVEDLEDSDAFQNERLYTTEQDVDNLEDENNLQGERISILEFTDISLEQRVTELEVAINDTDVTDLTERVDALEEMTSQLTDDVTALESADADMVDRLETLEAAILEPWEACESSPCDNGATCIDVNVDTFICACRDGFFGLTCENSSASTAFLAALNANVSPNGIIVFPQVHFNPGGHYDSSTGEYTAPYNGTYQFSVYLQGVQETTRIYLWVFVDDNRVYDDEWWHEGYRSVTLLQELSVGQVVTVQALSNSGDFNGESTEINSYFSGHLVYAN